jgi:hypothetical protein
VAACGASAWGADSSTAGGCCGCSFSAAFLLHPANAKTNAIATIVARFISCSPERLVDE